MVAPVACCSCSANASRSCTAASLCQRAASTSLNPSFTASGTTHKLEEKPADGKWFWRVSALDDAGFQGQPSKVYAFTVTP